MALPLLVVLLAGCAPDLDTAWRQRVVDRADARVLDPAVWETLYAQAPDAAGRAQVVRGLGQVRAPALAPLLSRWWNTAPSEPVREEILFALGQCKAPGSRALLRQALADDAAPVRARAAEALGKFADSTDVPPLTARLDDASAAVRGASLLALVRLRGRRAAPARPLSPENTTRLRDALIERLADASADVRWRAAYALAEIELPGRLGTLLDLAMDEDARIRLFAVRALGRLRGETDRRRRRLEAVLGNDTSPHVAAAAATALGALADARVLPVLLDAARRAGQAADHHIRAAAVTALARLPPDAPRLATSGCSARLIRATDDPSARVRAAALATLAALFPEQAMPILRRHAAAASGLARAAAATAAAGLPPAAAAGITAGLLDDPVPAVTAAALTTLAAIPGEEETARDAALRGLARPDAAVKGTALAILSRVGRDEDLAAIDAAFIAAAGSAGIEVREAAVEAAASLSAPPARDWVRKALDDPDVAVRRRAAEHLDRATPGREWIAGENRPSSVAVQAGIPCLAGEARPRVRLETTAGTIDLELFPDDAPRHVRSFLTRARAGLMDGLPFHRVVSGFVVQGLDAQGDGWGTAGVFLRDEINPHLFRAGAVGMPNSGPDSGGSQIFITHVPTPHLDGAYTVFGQVVSGLEVVDALDVGDICGRVTIVR
ncbi:MAG: HEAT repeat domain-containing protein [Acidobacteriota bacterium]